jgi:hypothetical protein
MSEIGVVSFDSYAARLDVIAKTPCPRANTPLEANGTKEKQPRNWQRKGGPARIGLFAPTIPPVADRRQNDQLFG